MKVFATNYLEDRTKDSEVFNKNEKWSWNPFQPVDKIIACGRPTNSTMYTGGSRPDERPDQDSPAEGMLSA